MKQGYIHLLPFMLKFLAGIRKIVRYHDVTPGSQITWNTAFLAVTGAYKRGGRRGLRRLLSVLEQVVTVPEEQLTDEIKAERLNIYQDANDAFRDLLVGKFGRLPLGFPPDWVYESAFGPDYRDAIARRTECSPLTTLEDTDIAKEQQGLIEHIGRMPTEEELLMYLSHPGDALNTIKFVSRYGDSNRLPLHVWFEGIKAGDEVMFKDSGGKHHVMTLQYVSRPDDHGMSLVSYTLDSESFALQVKVAEAAGQADTGVEMADPRDPYQVGSPSSGDLWVVHVKPGDMVKKGEELFNISIMKQEKSVLAPVDGMVERVLKFADYQEDKKMVPVKEGELLVKLMPAPRKCPTCSAPVTRDDFRFCPGCGQKV
jgi:pyruvate carboxylase